MIFGVVLRGTKKSGRGKRAVAAKRIRPGIIRDSEVFILGAEEFASSLLRGFGRAFSRTGLKTVEFERSAAGDLDKIFTWLGCGISDSIMFAMHGIRMFMIGTGRLISGSFMRVLESLEREKYPSFEEVEVEIKDESFLNAEKTKLKEAIRKLDAEYKRGTLDTRGYLRTRGAFEQIVEAKLAAEG